MQVHAIKTDISKLTPYLAVAEETKMLYLILSILVQVQLVFSFNARVDPLVLISQGLVRGQRATDGNYSTFLGIPYAQVNSENPFGAALPAANFNNIFNAYDASVKCPQNTGGFETLDCLRLNIYTPNEANSYNPLPVLVWIHGGYFSSRSGNYINPANPVKHGIVVVTINYRLGAYGFLCLDDPLVPGNQGLKDQLEALRWVKQNIAAFGGNPYAVTLGGDGAGSTSVLYHLYSPIEKLFNKIIILSNTPQNEHMFSNSDSNAALKIAEHLGFNADDSAKALEFLSNTPPSLVVAATNELNLQLRPCKEKIFDGVERIVTSDPLSMSNVKKVTRTPVLIGHTTREHKDLLLVMYGQEYLKSDPFYEKLKSNFNINDEELEKIAKIVRHFYIGDEDISKELLPVLEDFDSDFLYNHPIQRTVTNLLNENAGNIYQYLFSYSGNTTDDAGYGADTKYLFANPSLELNGNDQLVSERMVTLWVNFVKYGNPTPTTSNLLPVTWIPVSAQTRPYLVIDSDLKIEYRVFEERMAFWDLFYSVYLKYNRFLNQ